MNITVIGTGYVGLVSAVCFANAGHKVICLDIDVEKITSLRKGRSTIYEPGLEELLSNSISKNTIEFTTDIEMSVQHGDVQFICVGTPQSEDGSANLEYFHNALTNISQYMTNEKIIVNKSTVPIGTNLKAQKKIEEGLKKREIDLTFDIVSNPEFLREGCAIEDFLKPDRVIIGTDSEKTKKEMTELYSKVGIDSKKMIYMSPVSAELTKYSANGFLATKISFINEIANLAEKVGADINEIKLGIGADERIGKHFLNAGCGYGGSCFPKDIDALLHMSKQISNKELLLLQAVREVNIKQKLILFNKLELFFNGSLNNKKIAIWGLSFKPNTDDMRESPSITLIEKLIQSGSKIFAHDPEAIEECKKLIEDDKVVFCENIEDTTKDADAIVVVTDWEIYKEQDFSMHGNNLRRKLVLDGRNCLDKETITDLGFEYSGIGR